MTTILFEGVLNDDCIEKVGNHTYQLKYYLFATSWSNTEYNMFFKSLDKAIEYYMEHFSDRVLQQGKEWLKEDKVKDYPYTPEEYWKEQVYEMCYA